MIMTTEAGYFLMACIFIAAWFHGYWSGQKSARKEYNFLLRKFRADWERAIEEAYRTKAGR